MPEETVPVGETGLVGEIELAGEMELGGEIELGGLLTLMMEFPLKLAKLSGPEFRRVPLAFFDQAEQETRHSQDSKDDK